MTNISLGSGKAVHLAHVSTITGETLNMPECGGNRASERYRKTTREVTCKNCLKWLAAEAEKAERTAPAAEVAPAAESVAQQPEAQAAQQRLADALDTDFRPMVGTVRTDRRGLRYRVEKVSFRGARRHTGASVVVSGSVIDDNRDEYGVTTYGAHASEIFYDWTPAAEPVAEVAETPAAETEAPELDAITGWPIFTDPDGTRYVVSPRVQGPFGGVDFVRYRRPGTSGGQCRAYANAETGTLRRFLWDARARYDLDRQAAREAQRSGQMRVTNPPLTAEPKSAPARDAEAEQLDTAREALLRQLAGIDARLAELRPEPQATEVRVVMDSNWSGSAFVQGVEFHVFRGLCSWGVVGQGISSDSISGAATALARRLGVEGPVTVTLAPPLD